MTKKLFVVLVVVFAMLISISLVLAAKNAGLRHIPDQIEKRAYSNKHDAQVMPQAAVITQKAALSEQLGRPQKGTPDPAVLSGTPVRLGNPSGKDLCNLAGTAAYFINDYYYGLEWYANYQDPAAHGCTAVWPFNVTEIDFQMNFPATWVAMDVSVQGFVFEDVGTPSCPFPEATPGFVCSTPVYTFSIPAGGGYFILPMPLTAECCVYAPYFAVVDIITDLNGLGVDAVAEGVAATCRSYNDYGTGWGNLNSFPGPIMLYSQGYTEPQNNCPLVNTCGVSSVSPSNISILPGATADFTANVAFQGTQTSCFLTVTPDPACPSCVTTITPNPVVLPATSATISIATSASTAPGVYTFDCGGVKASATLTVLALEDSCLAARYIAGSGYRFDGWSAGDQNAVMLDPASMCTSCGTDVFPWIIKQINSRWANPSGATALDVIFHIYEAPTPFCNGPGAEIYQFPATITAWSPTVVTVPVPTVLCVDGPFWLAAEYVSVTPPAIVFPSCRMSAQTYADTCTQFNFYAPDTLGRQWIEWADFWTPPPPGYLWLSAIGNCAGEECPITCDMQQDNGTAAGYASWIWPGFQVAKWYNPEDYCEAPVYPYNITDVEFPIYKFGAAAAEVNLKIAVYLTCQDSCNGPGTQIFLSDVYNITSFYPNWIHIDLDQTLCVYEPFYVALVWQDGPSPMPSFLMDNNFGMPGDSCHQWFYDPDVPEWVEHHNWWGSPEAVGVTMLRVSGFTNSPVCDPPPCDTTIEMLAGASYAQYYWKQPANDEFMNMKFEMPADHGGRLEAFQLGLYLRSGSTWGTPDPDFYVWLSDGTYPLDNNPPYQAIASYHIDYSQIAWYPSYTYVSTYGQVLEFEPGEMFHIGFNHAHEPGDTLSILSNAGDEPGVANNPSGWFEGAWESYSPYAFLIDAYICPYAPEAPTFTMKCEPALGYGTPGDPPANVFMVGLTPVIGYNLPVTLSLLGVSPSAAITASFNPNPITPPDTLDVAITVAVGVPYGDYTLTFQAVGSDMQTKVCNVLLRVQPPYDEAVVNFFHGQQRTSTFGALGNDASTANFVWYGTNYLFDGSFLSATVDADHMAMDVYNCIHTGFIPTQHVALTHTPWCAPPYEENYGEVAFSNFYTEEDVISCEWDSVYVIGLSDVTSTDFSIKIRIFYNPTATPIPVLHTGIFEDWDIGDSYNNWVNMDELHNIIYQYDPVDENIVFGLLYAPFYDETMFNMVAVRNPVYVWPNSGFCAGDGLDLLYGLMTTPGFVYPTAPDTDFSVLASPPPFSLNPGEKRIQVWFDFGRNAADGFTWEQWYHRLLRYAGFYRGDVNASDTLELPALDISDLVYLINYLYQAGPAPQPFIDQGNVDGKGPYGGPVDVVCPKNNVDVQDLIYLINYVFKSGPAPIDYVRFIPSFWSRTSLFTNPNW